jgi:hypothetical protein
MHRGVGKMLHVATTVFRGVIAAFPVVVAAPRAANSLFHTDIHRTLV